MSFQSIVDTILNPLIGWLLDIHPFVAILILAVFLGLANTLLQKYMTDQDKMRRLKKDTKKYQVQMKELQKKGDQEKLMKVQKEMMPLQMQLMKESFRPLIVTMIPFLLIFFWLGNHFAYLPILPDQDFTVTAVFDDGVSGEAMLTVPEQLTLDSETQSITDSEVVWTLSGAEGRYPLMLSYAGGEISREVLITNEREYERPKEQFKTVAKEFNVDNQKLLPLGDGFNLFGWFPGWIFYYIIVSIPVSLLLKKVLKVV